MNALATPTSLITLPVAPGQAWAEQGGTYAGIMRGDDGSLYHLIISDAAGDLPSQEWGAYGKSEPKAASPWDGLANTQALVASKHAHPAAESVSALEINGFSDWYLPARRELALCEVIVPDLLKKDWYWSSTQYSPNNAWIQDFDGGYQYYIFKDGYYRARAVRRLVIQ